MPIIGRLVDSEANLLFGLVHPVSEKKITILKNASSLLFLEDYRTGKPNKCNYIRSCYRCGAQNCADDIRRLEYVASDNPVEEIPLPGVPNIVRIPGELLVPIPDLRQPGVHEEIPA